MNHEPPHQAAGMHRALRYLSLLLLPALMPKNVSGVSRSRPNADAALDLRGAEPLLLPYLAFVGAPPLRFQTAAPPPDLTVRPAAGAPPIPTSAPADAPAAPAESKSSPTVAANPASNESPASADKAASAPAKAPPPSILPDDARPSVRPEDFLPYFQIPGSGKPGEVNLLVPAAYRGAPAPAPLPPSSATYTQSK